MLMILSSFLVLLLLSPAFSEHIQAGQGKEQNSLGVLSNQGSNGNNAGNSDTPVIAPNPSKGAACEGVPRICKVKYAPVCATIEIIDSSGVTKQLKRTYGNKCIACLTSTGNHKVIAMEPGRCLSTTVKNLSIENKQKFQNLKPVLAQKILSLRRMQFERIKNLKKEQLEKLKDFNSEEIEEIASLPEESIQAITGLNQEQLAKVKALNKYQLWRLAKLKKPLLERIWKLQKENIGKLAELPLENLQSLEGLSEEELSKLAEMDKNSIETLTSMGPQNAKKLLGLGLVNAKKWIAKIGPTGRKVIAYKKARERYLLQKQKFLEAKNNYLHARNAFLAAKQKYLNAPDENKAEIKAEFLEKTRLFLINHISAVIERLNELKEKGTAPDSVDELTGKLNEMLATLENEELTEDEIIAIAKEFKELWTKQQWNARIRVIKNLTLKLEKAIDRANALLEKAEKVINKLEEQGTNPEKIQKARDTLEKFKKDLAEISEKIKKGKDLYNSVKEEDNPLRINSIAKKINNVAITVNRKLKQYHKFLVFLGRAYHKVKTGKTITEEIPQPLNETISIEDITDTEQPEATPTPGGTPIETPEETTIDQNTIGGEQ